MNDRPARSLRGGCVLVLVAAALLVTAGRSGLPRVAALAPAARPGVPVAGLSYFRLEPATTDTTLRLLVVPVRFPEDAALGGGDLEARLNAEGGSLFSYYRAATGGRLHVASTLAPLVVARHARSYYTVEGEGNGGYGLDPDAYPHNAQRLVEEVTEDLRAAVDFRSFDNTGDDVVDGLLVLHSGPAALESPPSSTPKSVLLPHAFTLPAPSPRGDAWVFPYALAAAADSVGPWAHEMGHLLGFPDLYVSNVFGTSEGLGRWSLMATGALRGGGGTPSGLDPFTRQLLGIPAARDADVPVSLVGGTFLRAFRAGMEPGPEYFLVERVEESDTAATVLYLVNEAAGDNTNPTRPLVEVRGVLCPGSGPCTRRLDDGSSPSLRDRLGNPTGLVLDLTEATVTARHEDLPPVRLARVELLDPQGDSQALALTVESLDALASVNVALHVTLSPGSPYRVALSGDTAWTRLLAPLERVTDTRYALAAVSPPLTAGTARLALAWTPAGGGPVRTDSVTVAVAAFGLPDAALASFTPRVRRGTARFRWENAAWTVDPLTPFADVELVSPWFTIPGDGRLLVEHAWSLEAPVPDLALDAAHVRLVLQTEPDQALGPGEPGWGYTADRGSGNALAGLPVLAGSGDRPHVLDLAPWARRSVQLVFRAAAWSVASGARWSIRRAVVSGPPAAAFTLQAVPADPELMDILPEGVPPPGTRIVVSGGSGPVTPVLELFSGVWPETGPVSARELPPRDRTMEIVWTEPGGASGTARATPGLPPARPPVLEPPFPNPAPRGGGQTWRIQVAEGETGSYRLCLFDASGRLVLERAARFDVSGWREVRWDGRDAVGRVAPAGVYVLECRTPGGVASTRKVVVIP